MSSGSLSSGGERFPRRWNIPRQNGRSSILPPGHPVIDLTDIDDNEDTSTAAAFASASAGIPRTPRVKQEFPDRDSDNAHERFEDLLRRRAAGLAGIGAQRVPLTPSPGVTSLTPDSLSLGETNSSAEESLFLSGTGYEESLEQVELSNSRIQQDNPSDNATQTSPTDDTGPSLQMMEQSRDALIVKKAIDGLSAVEQEELQRWEDGIYDFRRSKDDAGHGTKRRRLQRGLRERSEESSDSGSNIPGFDESKRRRQGGDSGEARGTRLSSRLQNARRKTASPAKEDDERVSAVFRILQEFENDEERLWKVWSDTNLCNTLMKQVPQDCDTRRKGSQAADLEQAAQVMGKTKPLKVGDTWKVDGMTSHLENYQLQVVNWMIRREQANTTPSGGIIADDPGTGKTVMSLACITNNPASAQDFKSWARTTLVVVPNKEVADQWLAETKKHCWPYMGEFSRVCNATSGFMLDDLENSEMVITTYSTIRNQFASRSTIRDLVEAYKEDQQTFHERLWAEMGNLFHINWYRIILDEAHMIKNMASSELYPYLAFIGYPLTASAKDFKQQYGHRNTDPLISLVLFRRTLREEYLGRRLVALPPVHRSDLWIRLSDQEQTFYNALLLHFARLAEEYNEAKEQEQAEILSEKRPRDIGSNGPSDSADIPRLNGILLTQELQASADMEDTESVDSSDELEDNEEHKLAKVSKMMRYRQAISHVFSLEKLFRSGMLIEDIVRLKTSLANDIERESVLDRLRADFSRGDDIGKYSEGLHLLTSRLRNALDADGRVAPLVSLAKNQQVANMIKCRLCKEAKPPLEPVESHQCRHIFCTKCLVRVCRSSRVPREKCPYPGCGVELEMGEDFETLNCVEGKGLGGRQHDEAGKDFNGVRLIRKGRGDGWFASSTPKGSLKFPPGAKATATMAVVLTWQQQAPQDKIIVFTQFVMTGKVIGALLQKMGVPFVYYYGDMTDKQKANALRKFKENQSIKVLLSQIQCGGQSLNLAMANRVIIVDPFFHRTLEEQALGRVVRRGQTKETHFVRIFAENTVDEQVFQIQERKYELIQRVLQDDGHEVQKFNKPDLKKSLLPMPVADPPDDQY